MDVKDMSLEEVKTNLEPIEERLGAIQTELAAEDADLDALTAEVDELEARKKELEARKAEIEAQIEKRAELEARVMNEGTIIKDFKQEEPKEMDVMEIRKSAEYVEAFANYIKTEDPTECRALLSENASGVVPVPSIVEDRVRQAWERDGIMSRVRKTYIKGNLRVGFELSATGAVVHTEGAAAPTEETLVLGVVSLVPASIKKWITISDEVMDLSGEAFLDYIYDEVTYQIAKKAAEQLVTAIVSAPTASTSTAVGIPVVTAASISQSLVAEGLGNLSDSARDVVIIMNRATEASFKAVQYAGKFATDIFEGLDREYTSALKSFSAATTGETFAIIGDLGEGAQANFPNGQEIRIKFDDTSLAEADLVKIVGREFVAIGVVGPGCFVKLVKG